LKIGNLKLLSLRSLEYCMIRSSIAPKQLNYRGALNHGTTILPQGGLRNAGRQF
jgi:hypothetical protein